MARRWATAVVAAWCVDAGMATARRRHWLAVATNTTVISPAARTGPVSDFRFLFHKARIGVSDIHARIPYYVHARPGPRKRIVAHLHILDLNTFDDVYGRYLALLQTYCSLVVTYSVPSEKMPRLAPGDSMLRIQNRGMDVGAKFCAVRYLMESGGREPELVLFLHSKSDPKQRYRYYEWYLNQLPLIPSPLPPDVGGIFSPFLIMHTPGWPRNTLYMQDLIGFFELESDFFAFPEGNCFFLSFDVARAMYSDSRLYNMLNTNETIDISWILEYYHLQSISQLRRMFQRGHVAYNNLHLGAGHDGLADSMLEHAFERLPLLVVRQHGKIGVFDFATKPVDILTVEPSTVDIDQPRIRRAALDDAELRTRYFSTTKTKYDRVALFACHGSSPLRVSTIVNNLFYLSQIAFHIVVVDSTAQAPTFLNFLEARDYRDFFIVNDVLTDVQCRWYAHHLDLSDLDVEGLREHYKLHGRVEQRYVPHVIARITVIKTANTAYLCHHKWLVALNTVDLAAYSDYILTNDSILFCRSLVRFASTFRDTAQVTGFLASNEAEYHLPDFLRRYNPVGVAKIRDFFAKKINMSKAVTYDDLVRDFEIGSCVLFSTFDVYHKAEPDSVNVHFAFPYVKDWIRAGYEVVKLRFLNMRRFDYPTDIAPAQRPRYPGDLPRDFNPIEYAQLNPDLGQMHVGTLIKHFKLYGFYEGRAYSWSQRNQLPGFLRSVVHRFDTGHLVTFQLPLPHAPMCELRKFHTYNDDARSLSRTSTSPRRRSSLH